MALDPSIFQSLNIDLSAFDPMAQAQKKNALLAMQQQQMQFAQAKAAQDQANAIKGLLSEPGAYDQANMITPQKLRQIQETTGDPLSVEPYLKYNAAMEKTEQDQKARQTDYQKSRNDAAEKVRVAALQARINAKQAGMTDAAADHQMQEVYTEQLSSLGNSGLFSAAEIAQMPKTADYQRMYARSSTFNKIYGEEREQEAKIAKDVATAEKEGVEARLAPKKVAIEEGGLAVRQGELALSRRKEAESGWTVMNDPTTGATIRYNARTGKASTLDGTRIKAPESVEKQTGRAPTYAQMAAGAFRREFKAKNGREPTSAEILADQASGKGMARTATLKSQMDYYSNETKGLIPQYVDRVSALSLPQVKMFRDALLAGKTQVSDPAVSKALLASNAVAGAYARSLAPTGAGDAETRKHARDLLGITSPADARAKGEQLLSEISAIKASAKESAAEEMSPDGTAPAAPAGVTEYVWNPATKKTEKVQR